MIPDWQTREVWFSSLFPERYPSVWANLSVALQKHGIPTHLLTGTKDVWVRDFMPVPVSPERLVKFRYTPDYLRGFPKLRTGNEITECLPFREKVISSPIILDGGNIVASNTRVILTDKVFRENPRIERNRLLTMLTELFEGAELILIPQEPGDPIGHSDGIVRFVDEGTVVVNDYSQIEPEFGTVLESLLSEAGLQILRMPYSIIDHFGKDGLPSAAGNYVNYLRIANVILLPAFETNDDCKAHAVLQAHLPNSEIQAIRCTSLAVDGGVLNCISWCL